jgi:Ca2+-binding EF-hand superfamily protein
MMKEFDKNGDGELDEEERNAMRETLRQRFGGPGGPGGGGRGPGFNREEMLKRFDKNGDGELDEEEREAMRAEFGRNRSRTNAPPRSAP